MKCCEYVARAAALAQVVELSSSVAKYKGSNPASAGTKGNNPQKVV